MKTNIYEHTLMMIMTYLIIYHSCIGNFQSMSKDNIDCLALPFVLWGASCVSLIIYLLNFQSLVSSRMHLDVWISISVTCLALQLVPLTVWVPFHMQFKCELNLTYRYNICSYDH
jgi:hypothetical protein